ncbi:hypothetical protein HYQ46_012220 [Verticillium longisporum]|nr:hypothetical protein HYQ46_012220 [Verticillium longisporum]
MSVVRSEQVACSRFRGVSAFGQLTGMHAHVPGLLRGGGLCRGRRLDRSRGDGVTLGGPGSSLASCSTRSLTERYVEPLAMSLRAR